MMSDEFEALQAVSSGAFQFDGDPEKFKIFAEAERINSAYQFDPLFAVIGIVDPLPTKLKLFTNTYYHYLK